MIRKAGNSSNQSGENCGWKLWLASGLWSWYSMIKEESYSVFWTRPGSQWFSGNTLFFPFFSPFSLCNRVNEATVRCCMGFLCGWCSSSEVLLFFCSIFCHFVADLQQRQLIREGAVAAVFQSWASFRQNLLGAPVSGKFRGTLQHVRASLRRHLTLSVLTDCFHWLLMGCGLPMY